MSHENGHGRVRQVVVGVALIAVLTVTVCGALVWWRKVPGVLGEWIGTMIGAMTSPFLLETSFFFIGIGLVSWLNHLRARKEGDEWVDPASLEAGAGRGEGKPQDPS